MYHNPPYKYVCRHCKPNAYFREYNHLRAHFRVHHSMRQLPPASPGWYDAPLGLNGEVEPQFVRTFDGRSQTGITPRGRAGLNDGASTSSAADENVESPITREMLRQMVEKAVNDRIQREMRGRLPLLANEIQQTVDTAMREQLPNLVSDTLFDVAQQIAGGNLDQSQSNETIRARLQALRDANKSQTDVNNDPIVIGNPVNQTEISDLDPAASSTMVNIADSNPENSVDESLGTQTKRICEEADALMAEMQTPRPPASHIVEQSADPDQTESDDELMQIDEAAVIDGNGNTQTNNEDVTLVNNSESEQITADVNAVGSKEEVTQLECEEKATDMIETQPVVGDETEKIAADTLAVGPNEEVTQSEREEKATNMIETQPVAGNEEVSIEDIQSMFEDTQIPELIFPPELDEEVKADSVIDLVTPPSTPKE